MDINKTIDTSNGTFESHRDPLPGWSDIIARWRQENWTELTEFTIVYTILSVIGVIGNSLVLWAYLTKRVVQVTVYFVLALAVVDLLTSLFVMPMTIYFQWKMYVPYSFICIMVEMGRNTLIPTSSMLLAAVACERYLLICHPLRFHVQRKHILLTILVILILGLGMSIVPSLAFGVVEGGSGYFLGHCETMYVLISRETDSNYRNFTTAFFCFMALVISVCYALIFIRVYNVNRNMSMYRRPKMSKMSRKDDTNEEHFGMGDTGDQPVIIDQSKSSDAKCTKGSRSTSLPDRLPRKSYTARPATLLPLQEQSITEAPSTEERTCGKKDEGVNALNNRMTALNNRMNAENDRINSSASKLLQTEETSIPGIFSTESSSVIESENKMRHWSDPGCFSGVAAPQIDNPTTKPPQMCHQPQLVMINQMKVTTSAVVVYGTPSQAPCHFPTAPPDPLQTSEAPYRSTKVTPLQPIQPLESINSSSQSPHNSQTQSVPPKQAIRSSAHWHTAWVMLLVSLGFLAAYVPTTILWYIPTGSMSIRQQIPYYLYFLNNVVNPIIYSVTNRNFRHTVAEGLCCRRSNKVQPS